MRIENQEFVIFYFNFYLIESMGYLYLPFFIWMLIDCIRNEPDRNIWIWVIIIVQGLGLFIYFFSRYLPRGDNKFIKSFFAQFQTKELKQLQYQAKQIGNAYHWIHYGDKLRELQRFAQAEQAYRTAMKKESDNIQALWGLAICLEKLDQLEESLKLVTQL